MNNTLFPDIFTKLESINTKPVSPVTQVWKQITPTVFQCKITGKKLSKVQFLRYQDFNGGIIGFVVEIKPSNFE